MLTLYGDYVRHKGGEIGIGSLIRLLANFGLSEQSIRSAVSRMCRTGLLQARRKDGKSYYSLTSEGASMISKGAQRIFERKEDKWDGLWSTVIYFIPEEKREARDRLRQELGWMGYGPLAAAAWISPHDSSAEIEELAGKLGIGEYIQIFQSRQKCRADGHNLICRCWDLKHIHQKYTVFIEEYLPRLEKHRARLQAGETITPDECFVERFQLIDEYRRLPFYDPDLPEELLPSNWLRAEARELFDTYHDLLTKPATEYFDAVYEAY